MIQSQRIFMVFASLTLLALACQLGGTPAEPTLQVPTSDILFQDDFSDSTSGWDSFRDAEGMTDYDEGTYRIQVNQANFDFWANPGLNFTDVRIEVTATKVGGPDENDFGIICRYQDTGNFYFFIVGSDGFYGIGKVVGDEQQLVGMEEMNFSNVINRGDTSNQIRAECIGNSLTLFVNDDLVADVTDGDFNSGDVGLIAGTFDEPGTDIRFDDFIVRNP